MKIVVKIIADIREIASRINQRLTERTFHEIWLLLVQQPYFKSVSTEDVNKALIMWKTAWKKTSRNQKSKARAKARNSGKH
jgi:hypothetical protein